MAKQANIPNIFHFTLKIINIIPTFKFEKVVEIMQKNLITEYFFGNQIPASLTEQIPKYLFQLKV